jgi:transporter family protein
MSIRAADRPTTPPQETPPGRGTTRWLIPTVAFIVVNSALGITSELALRTLAWQELVVWVGIGYMSAAAVAVALGRTNLRFVGGTPLAIGSAALAICSIITLYLALAAGEVSKVVPVSAAYPAVTLILSAVVLSERLSVARVGGMCLVVAGVVVLSLY